MTARHKVTIRKLQSMKAERAPIAVLGVYESVTARLADEVGIPLFLTGPSGPMSLFGRQNPTQISFAEQLVVLRAVTRVTNYALVAAHVPFLAFQSSARDAILNAGRLVSEGGADVVKCDATAALASNIEAIVLSGIPVMAHMGVQALRRTEQSGYGLKGSTAETAKRLIEEANMFADVGVFAIIVEHVCADVAAVMSERLKIPVISLGSGSRTDGVCIVTADLLNFSAFPKPAHAMAFTDLRHSIDDGLRRFSVQVRSGEYPDPKDAIHMDAREYANFLALAGAAEDRGRSESSGAEGARP